MSLLSPGAEALSQQERQVESTDPFSDRSSLFLAAAPCGRGRLHIRTVLSAPPSAHSFE